MDVKTYPAEIHSLYVMLNRVRHEAERAGFDSPTISKIELAVEEALVNIINYAYINQKEDGKLIDLDFYQLDNGLKIVITDKGIPYNPLKYKKNFSQSTPFEERELGGYGIFFILNLMDEVNYNRKNQSNILTLIKHKN